MSRDRKLRLVGSSDGNSFVASGAAEPPEPGGAEIEHGARLVRAVVAPAELDRADHELLLALTVGESSCELSEADRQRAAELGGALDALLDRDAQAGAAVQAGSRTERLDPELQALIELGQALRAASCRGSIDELTNERLIQQAQQRVERAHRQPRASRRWALLGSAAAVAAGVAIFFASFAWRQGPERSAMSRRPTPAAVVPAALQLIPARSTEMLFDPAEKFPVRGGESARVDKIARARAADLRANRFAAWGVP